VHSSGRDEILGTAYSDHDFLVFLEGAGIAHPEAILDDPQWVEWRGGAPPTTSAPPDVRQPRGRAGPPCPDPPVSRSGCAVPLCRPRWRGHRR
jgi:hypothetical protein